MIGMVGIRFFQEDMIEDQRNKAMEINWSQQIPKVGLETSPHLEVAVEHLMSKRMT